MNNQWLDAGDPKDDRAIVPCPACNQWGAVYTMCGQCGHPVYRLPADENESPFVACDHCMQFGTARTECQHCGAPMPDEYDLVEVGSYFVDGGVSFRASPYWADEWVGEWDNAVLKESDQLRSPRLATTVRNIDFPIPGKQNIFEKLWRKIKGD